MSPYTTKLWIPILLCCSFGARADAATVFSNLGPGQSLNGPGVGIGFIPFTGTFNYAGIGFTMLAGPSYTLETIELPLRLFGGPNVVDVFLMEDLAGLPGTILESFHVENALSLASDILLNLPSLDRPVLSAATDYWIVAAGGPATFISWRQNELGEMGPNVSGPDLTGLIRNSDSNVRMAARVGGTLVPEPDGTLPVFAGLGFLLLIHKRKVAV
jgi:hypothetical protein